MHADTRWAMRVIHRFDRSWSNNIKGTWIKQNAYAVGLEHISDLNYTLSQKNPHAFIYESEIKIWCTGCSSGFTRSFRTPPLDGNVEAHQSGLGFHARSVRSNRYHSIGTERGILINCSCRTVPAEESDYGENISMNKTVLQCLYTIGGWKMNMDVADRDLMFLCELSNHFFVEISSSLDLIREHNSPCIFNMNAFLWIRPK